MRPPCGAAGLPGHSARRTAHAAQANLHLLATCYYRGNQVYRAYHLLTGARVRAAAVAWQLITAGPARQGPDTCISARPCWVLDAHAYQHAGRAGQHCTSSGARYLLAQCCVALGRLQRPRRRWPACQAPQGPAGSAAERAGHTWWRSWPVPPGQDQQVPKCARACAAWGCSCQLRTSWRRWMSHCTAEAQQGSGHCWSAPAAPLLVGQEAHLWAPQIRIGRSPSKRVHQASSS